MSKKAPLLLAALLIVAAAGVATAQVNQPPIGFLDVPASDGVGASGSYAVIGWAIDDSGIVDHIDFLVDGVIVAGAVGNGQPSSALYGTTRPDVFAAFPNFPNSLNSGFVANIDTTRLIDGVHVFSVRAFDNQGASTVLGTRSVQVINNGASLPPFGFLDVPLDKASLHCNLPPASFGPIPLSFYDNVVEGWALDVGSRLDRGQVAYVELLLDGVILANSRRDCVQVSKTLANCYGLNRPDVARVYSGYVNADNSGFLFLFALNQDPFTGLIEILMPGALGEIRSVGFTFSGKHTLAIRAGDEKETVTQFAAISVDILCDTGPFFDRPAIGYIDTPSPGQFIKGVFTFSGWAFDPDNGGRAAGFNGATRIDIDIDGRVVGSLSPPFLSRPDVPANDFRVPTAPGVTPPTSFTGWAFNFDTSRLSDSEHDLVVYVVDTPDPSIGRPAFRSEIGRRKFVVFNNNTVK